jgi:hypothetical protein
MFAKEQGLKMAIAEITDFFRKEAQECRTLAAQATAKNDREYWLRLAHGWEWLLQQNNGTETAQPLRRGRSVLERRFAKRRAA